MSEFQGHRLAAPIDRPSWKTCCTATTVAERHLVDGMSGISSALSSLETRTIVVNNRPK